MPGSGATPPVIRASEARRLALLGAGLLDDPARRATSATLQKTIERLGYVQVDSINVVERAHHLTLFTRLAGYRHKMLTHLLEKRRSVFEHWTHDASIVPTDLFPYWKPRFARSQKRLRANGWWNERIGDDANKVIRHVLDRIGNEGPLMARDFEHNREGESSGWWGWKPQKAALEYLWHTGQLAVTARRHFHKVYDLTERVIPEAARRDDAPDRQRYIDWACTAAMERLIVAAPAQIAGFLNAIKTVEAGAWAKQTLAGGRLVRVMVESADGSGPHQAFATSNWRRRLTRAPEPPDPPTAMRVINPFDPILRDRRRALRLFDFDYRFEAFVPAPKRQYGYYVFALLAGDRLVGRFDAKHHRKAGVLEIPGLWWEPGIRATRARKSALDKAIGALAGFIGADRVDIRTTRGA